MVPVFPIPSRKGEGQSNRRNYHSLFLAILTTIVHFPTCFTYTKRMAGIVFAAQTVAPITFSLVDRGGSNITTRVRIALNSDLSAYFHPEFIRTVARITSPWIELFDQLRRPIPVDAKDVDDKFQAVRSRIVLLSPRECVRIHCETIGNMI